MKHDEKQIEHDENDENHKHDKNMDGINEKAGGVGRGGSSPVCGTK